MKINLDIPLEIGDKLYSVCAFAGQLEQDEFSEFQVYSINIEAEGIYIYEDCYDSRMGEVGNIDKTIIREDVSYCLYSSEEKAREGIKKINSYWQKQESGIEQLPKGGK